jgi:hypothetical protein
MKLEEKILLGIVCMFVAAIFMWEYTSEIPNLKMTKITPESMRIGLSNPKLWIFYNTSEVNSRNWFDFGARTDTAINVPLLNMLYERIAKHNGTEYNIQVIGGLEGVAEQLGGWKALPLKMQNPKARISKEEQDWIRTAILAKYGGLWLSPSIVSLEPIGKLPDDSIVLFNNDVNPTFDGIWVPHPDHPLFVKWEEMIRNRLNTQLGGYNFRNDAANDWNEIKNSENTNIINMDKYELSKHPKTGKKLQLEDILASGTEGNLPFKIPCGSKYILIPYNDLLNRRAWGWVLRMSEQQLMLSDLAITHILRRYHMTK